MNQNEELINRFYNCFKNKDFRAMQACYADNATFSDEVFVGLNAAQVKAMWEMLCIRGKDLTLEYRNVTASEKSGTAEWTAHYTFSSTGKKVVNHVKASFLFENGKIVKHTDTFSFYTWATQALGITGLLLGWMPSVKKKVRETAMKNLEKFMETK